ncbi:unnamed protein product, partial [Mesorhabditis spiculigera]
MPRARPIILTAMRAGMLMRGAAELSTSAVPLRAVVAKNPAFRITRHATTASTSDAGLPTKEKLLSVDWIVEHQLPGLFKQPLTAFMNACDRNIALEDRLYNYNLTSKESLFKHIAKLRIYFRYKFPFVKVEHIGSCIYEGEDMVTILWRLTYLKSSFANYLPSFMTGRTQPMTVEEGAMDLHVHADGTIYKIVNRKLTAADREGSNIMKQLKLESQEERTEKMERHIRKEINQQL